MNEAPKFYEVADAIRLRLEGSVFVSHNTEFDLGLLKKKFSEMGQELKVKNFCTLKVAQHEIPGLRNYNLDALCSFFGIKIRERHRAVGDALATLDLFRELMQLRLKTYPKILHLPHHEKILKKLPAKAGLVTFKDHRGRVIKSEPTFNIHKTAYELLEVKFENKDLLTKTEFIEGEVTGSALIAEFRQLINQPYRPLWAVITLVNGSGEKSFRIKPFKRGVEGLWYFIDYFEARKKIQQLEKELKGEVFAYRDSARSKEEILRHNQKVDLLSRETRFPSDNLVIVGEGRTIGERSLVVIRNNHVMGYGYTEASDETIYESPESFVSKRIFQHLGIDLAARKYIRVLKNVRNKTEKSKASGYKKTPYFKICSPFSIISLSGLFRVKTFFAGQ